MTRFKKIKNAADRLAGVSLVVIIPVAIICVAVALGGPAGYFTRQIHVAVGALFFDLCMVGAFAATVWYISADKSHRWKITQIVRSIIMNCGRGFVNRLLAWLTSD